MKSSRHAQASSDIFTVMQTYFDEHIDEEKYCGYVHGLGTTSYNGNGYSTVADDSQ